MLGILGISDRSAIQGRIKWKIKNKDVLAGKKKITYISPGGFSFITNDGKNICFDWQDSASNYLSKEGIIESELYSFDYNFITDSLKENNYKDLIAEEYRLPFFDDFKELDTAFCLVDIDMEECEDENLLECVYFELYDPISNEVLMLVGDYDVGFNTEKMYKKGK